MKAMRSGRAWTLGLVLMLALTGCGDSADTDDVSVNTNSDTSSGTNNGGTNTNNATTNTNNATTSTNNATTGGGEAGGLGQACYPNGTCDAGLECEGDVCVEAAEPCGAADEPCCDGLCEAGLVCEAGFCEAPEAPCGASGEACCDGLCEAGLVCEADVCEPPEAPCGAAGELCCDGLCEAGLACEEGVCEAPEACGALGAPCCEGDVCADGLTCENGSCAVACGDANQACCEGDACADELACVDGQCEDLTGLEGGPCFANATCNAGLACEDDLCVPTCTGSAPPATQSQGVCLGLLQVCAGTEWVDPDYTEVEGYSATDDCADDLDNNCDGQVNEGCACVPEEQRACGNDGTGACVAGVQTCSAEGQWSDCDLSDAVGPAPETCNGIDDDCNGEVDNDLQAPAASLTEGVCAGAVQVCAGQLGWIDPTWTDIEGYEPVEQTCDGLDNDCDGQVDEDLSAPLATVQAGVCEGSLKRCVDGAWVEPALFTLRQIPGYEQQERTNCDGLDNDCDGLTDGEEDALPECVCDPGDSRPCGSDEGICTTGLEACGSNGAWSGVCEGSFDGESESCNGLDDDCDGMVDDVGLGEPIDAPGVCAGQRYVCMGEDGWQEPDWSQLPDFEAAETRCDGLDNDCDGDTDSDDADVAYPDPESSEPNDDLQALGWPSRALLNSNTPGLLNDTDYTIEGNFNTTDAVDMAFGELFFSADRNYLRCTVEALDPGLEVRVWLGLRTSCDAGCNTTTGGSCCGVEGNTTQGHNTGNGCQPNHGAAWTRFNQSSALAEGDTTRLRLDMIRQSSFWNAAPCSPDGSNMYGRLVVRVEPVEGTVNTCASAYRISCRVAN